MFASTYIFLSWVLSFLLVLLSVAFFTLFERKVMGLVHLRVGPNKVSYFGLMQPLLDAFKLLSKSYLLPKHTNMFFLFSPYLSLFLSLILWVVVPSIYTMASVSFSLLAFMCITSLLVFPLLISGWASNSKYTYIGCLRSVAQSISYEAVFSTLMVLVMTIHITYSLTSASLFHFLGGVFLFPLWLFCVLAESHRAPFDFSESESELVSGFNTEYSGSMFAFIFLSEYSTLLVSSFVMSWLFLGVFLVSSFFVVFFSLILAFLVIVIRVTFCRFRYDLLMMAAWKVYLPVSLMLFSSFLFLL